MGSRSRSIRFKIFLLLLLPLLMLSALWGFVLNLTVGDGLALLRANTLYESVGVTSTDLGLQIQAERALTAGLLSTGQTSSATLTAQQAKTSAAVEKFSKTARDEAASGSIGGELQTPLDTLLSSLNRLPSMRESVMLGKFDRLQAINAYNGLMDELFAVYERLVSVPDLTIFQQAGALQGMGNAYEMIAREDALIRGALASGRLSQQERNAFSEWVAARRFLYRKNRPVLAGPMRQPYEEVLTSPLFDRFASLEDRLVSEVRSGGPFPADGDKWTPTVDNLVLRLDAARAKASDALTADATSVANGIMARIAIAGGLGFVAIVGTILFSVRFGRRLARGLAGLRDSALDLADVRLPQVVEKLRRGEEVDLEAEAPPVQAGGSIEVEDVAHALSSVRRTAVEAAVGQANLRRGVNQVFLNLARRKQSLLHRQLSLLDAMQRRADDPESLDDLFRLDHLTTRMRRHAEGLIILSGATPGRSWRTPVPVIDVVRAAIAEVEDYTRVSMLPMPNAALAGATVADIVHLIAELLENATIFSPPQTKVQVRGEVVANGLVLEIEDRGLGLTPEEYAEINQRLSDPPEFDLADSDRLGLFVVSQLAARYGIGVVLRNSPYGGTTSIVLVPRALVADDGSPAAITGSATRTPGGAHAQPALTGPALTGPALTGRPVTDSPRTDLTVSGLAPTGPALTGSGGSEPQDEPENSRSGPATSPFFTPASLRTEAVPSAARDDLPEEDAAPGLSAAHEVPSGLPGTSGAFPASIGASDLSHGTNGTTHGTTHGTSPGAGSNGSNGSAQSDSDVSAQEGSAQSDAAQNGSGRNGPNGLSGSVSKGTHAGLPRRVRQANIAPQLRTQPLSAPVSSPEERSPEEARALFSAFQRGARRGREDSEQPGDGASGDHAHNTHGEKGDQ